MVLVVAGEFEQLPVEKSEICIAPPDQLFDLPQSEYPATKEVRRDALLTSRPPLRPSTFLQILGLCSNCGACFPLSTSAARGLQDDAIPERHEESHYMDSGSFDDERAQVQCRGANLSR